MLQMSLYMHVDIALVQEALPGSDFVPVLVYL